tara:strand:- start:357 stop:632 length:276 start_codon:yes stop_codon:yes gene_type:complete
MSSKKVRITKAELKSLNDAMSELKIHEQKLLQVVGAEQDLIKMKADAYGKFTSSRKAYSELSQRLEKRYGQVIIDTVSGAISEANDNKGNT